jgi:thiol:disulfide interchange protein DsbD
MKPKVFSSHVVKISWFFAVHFAVFAGLIGPSISAQELSLESSFKLKKDTRSGVLTVTAKVPDDWHTFSVSQKPGGPMKSKLTVKAKGLKLTGAFVPQEPPHVSKSDIFEMKVEEHEGTVHWLAPFELTKGTDPSKLALDVKYRGQICSDTTGQCKLAKADSKATFKGFADKLTLPKAAAEKEDQKKPKGTPLKLALEPYQPKGMHVSLTGSIFTDDGKRNFKPGDTVTLEVTAVPLEDFHFYAYETTQERIYNPTLISFMRPSGWTIVGPTVSNEPKLEHEMFVHHETTTWTFKVTIPKNAAPDQAIAITGGVQILTCNDDGCDRPADSQFTVTVPMGNNSAAALKFGPAKTNSVKKAVDAGNFADPLSKSEKSSDKQNSKPSDSKSADEKESNQQQKSKGSLGNENDQSHNVFPDSDEQIAAMARLYDPKEKITYLNYSEMDANPVGSGGTSSASQTSFGIALLFAFLGGAILNLMPCVFPVLGIKVMGFVKQGGEKASKVRMHGFAFAAGLVVSMWILAGGLLILKNGFGQNIIWGEQMANPYFVGGIIVLLFLLGLNMAGVFEIGTSLTSVGGKVTNKGGYSGSFFSGVLTTLIATPCSGPFLGAAMTYALSQTAIISMVMFTVFGLGIAFPYVLLTMFPPLIKSLPKPGPWMETFKVTMAFALFATVAWFMQTFGAQTGVDGVSYMLMGLVIVGLAAYFFGTWGEGHIAKGKRWVFGYALPVIIAAGGFWAVYNGASQFVVAEGARSEVSDGPIPWVTWNPGKVKQELAGKQIVWADYTADW